MAETKDWRIGLTVRAKLRNDPLYYERGTVLDIFQSGTGGIVDLSGVLKLKMEGGSIVLRGADDWVTA